MNEHTLRILEFDKIKAIVSGFAASMAGRDAITGLLPATEQGKVILLLRETREFTGILQSGETPPLDGVPDIRSSLGRLRISGGMFMPTELLDTATLLSAGRRVKNFFQRYEERDAGQKSLAPLLSARVAMIRPLKHLEDAVFSAIDERAEVRDSASPALRRVRKQLNRLRDDILGRLTGILQDGGFQKVIQEAVITIRDDRYVVPLKPNFRQSIKGVVHGQSGSRSTLFVEPLDILEQNNHLAELRMEEREEVERILRELTGQLSQEADAIECMVGALTAIDAISARSRFGLAFDGVIPVISLDRELRLRGARHPLLMWKQRSTDGRDVTPNDIELTGGDRVLVLSGPNAGGKTAILKTAGILCLMAQSGLPVTAAEGSELPCFRAVFADIGDEQSLEQDLSTFSSHVSQIAEILRQAEPDSLVLLDELGSGTDPGEGAGLGAAVLENLIARGCVTLTTTHHNSLKLFGAQTSGAKNASMEFDPLTLRPTYRLLSGRPGRSYGLDMAARLGVPEDVIRNARARIDPDDARLETLLKQVEEDSTRLTAEREQLEHTLSAAQHDQQEAEAALREARAEARAIKARGKEESREVLSALRQRLRDLSRTPKLDTTEIRKTASEVEALGRQLDAEAPHPGSTLPGLRHSLCVGDQVRIARLNRTGIVLAVHRGMLEVEVDNKKLKVTAEEVNPLGPAPIHQHASTVSGWGADFHESDGPSDRLNIIGLRVEEGLIEVDRFIDRTGVNGLSFVTIIHGLGTGALKSAVTKYLSNHPLVAAIRQGEPAEGGAGVTVAELKK